MKKTILIITLLICGFNNAQEQDQRILKIKNQLEFLATEVNGLTENVKTEINVANITLSNFLLAISEVHKVNINISPQLNQISIANNFTDVSVADLLIFLCKEYNLTIDFTGNILSIKQFVSAPDIPKKRIIPIAYNPSNQTISIDAKGDSS